MAAKVTFMASTMLSQLSTSVLSQSNSRACRALGRVFPVSAIAVPLQKRHDLRG